jgi:hypothetical protein
MDILGLNKKELNYLANTASGEVGKEIYRQIKYFDKWALASWGAKNFVTFDAGKDLNMAHEGGLKFKVKGSKFKGWVMIYLTPMDLYTIVLGRVRGVDWKVVKTIDNIYFDQLVEILNENIG